MKTLAPWLKKKMHSAEIIHCDDDTFSVMLHDATGASSEGFGETIDAAFLDAHKRYTTARHRASLTTSRYTRRAP